MPCHTYLLLHEAMHCSSNTSRNSVPRLPAADVRGLWRCAHFRWFRTNRKHMYRRDASRLLFVAPFVLVRLPFFIALLLCLVCVLQNYATFPASHSNLFAHVCSHLLPSTDSRRKSKRQPHRKLAKLFSTHKGDYLPWPIPPKTDFYQHTTIRFPSTTYPSYACVLPQWPFR